MGILDAVCSVYTLHCNILYLSSQAGYTGCCLQVVYTLHCMQVVYTVYCMHVMYNVCSMSVVITVYFLGVVYCSMYEVYLYFFYCMQMFIPYTVCR